MNKLWILAGVILATALALVAPPPCKGVVDIRHTLGLIEARRHFSDMGERMERVSGILQASGLEGLAASEEANLEGVFVIDAASGRVLLGDARTAADLYHINARALARETLEHASTHEGEDLIRQISESSRDLYGIKKSRLVVTRAGERYVVVACREGLDLERLFIQRLIERAIDLVRRRGIDEALAHFEDPGGDFRTQHTYVFVYEGDRCLFNPNYPELEGKRPDEMAPAMGTLVRSFLHLAHTQRAGWIEVVVRNPVTGEEEPKWLYVQRTRLGGVPYTVGSGIYEGRP